MDGPGEDYRGRFVIALFGETAPMTVMNFVAIARGYKRGKVSEVLKITSPIYAVQLPDILNLLSTLCISKAILVTMFQTSY